MLFRNRPNAKRARRALLLTGWCILGGEILAGLLIDRAGVEIRFPELPKLIRVALQQGRSPDIVFFGSSRFQSLLNAQVVRQEIAEATNSAAPLVLNASVSYGDTIAMDFVSAKTLETGVRPSVVVLEVSPETVSRRSFAFPTHVMRQFKWPDMLGAFPDMLWNLFWSGAPPLRLLSFRLIPAYRFRSEFQQWALEALGLQFPLFSPEKTLQPEAGAAAQPHGAPAELRLKGAAVTRQRLRHFKVGGLSARALERMIERYKTLGATSVLVGVPISNPSRSEYVPEINAAFLAYMERLEESYGVYFVDYRDRVPDEFFKSAYYTTREGTLYFSCLLAREVLVPLWRERNLQTAATPEPNREQSRNRKQP